MYIVILSYFSLMKINAFWQHCAFEIQYCFIWREQYIVIPDKNSWIQKLSTREKVIGAIWPDLVKSPKWSVQTWHIAATKADVWAVNL